MIVPLVVRSSYSFLRGMASPALLAAAAKKAGLSRLGLSDRNGVYGVPTFVEECRRQGIEPIPGVEMSWKGGRCVLIPRDRVGFSMITRMLTEEASHPSKDGKAAVLSLLALPGASDSLFALTDDAALLARAPVYALATNCNASSWSRLAASGREPVYSPEVSFLDASGREVQRLLLAIGRTCSIHEVSDDELDPPGALWNEALLGPPSGGPGNWLARACDNNARVAAEALHTPFSGLSFPRYKEGSLEESQGLLRALVREGAHRRYGTVEGKVGARIDYELGLIGQKGFSDYFLVVRDIVGRASRICGRGSAAASIVSYCLGITEVDPIRHDLYFERFLNPGRTDPPDIDVDFAWDERDDLLADVIASYGPAHAARVANHNCFRSRSALRETARAFGMPDTEIAAFERSLKVNKEATLESADSEWKKIAALASSIIGLPRHLGAHSGGLIIVPDDLADHVPIEETGNGIRVIAWDKDGAEEAGLVKIDLLGNRSLAVVRDAMANLIENGRGFDIDRWRPVDDEATVSLLARGDTMGVFYVESPAMRVLQTKTRRGDFAHLVIHSSIIRPAANRYINEYVDRLEGKPWKSLHPLLEGLFDESCGILCYQEDVSKAAIALAGFSAAEADGIRKILSKKDADARLHEYWGSFRDGARGKGVDDETIIAVWDMIKSFSGYSFVKAHSASYAMLSFQSAYLRAHFPAEFMAAVMSNHGGYYSTLAYASESRRMGLVLLPPDVNASESRCRGREREIRFGLGMIGSLSTKTALFILDERKRAGPYLSIEDFARRVPFERSDAEALVGSGALDSLTAQAPGRSGALMTLLSTCAAREGSNSFEPELFAEEALGAVASRRAAGQPAAALPAGPSPRRRGESEMKYLGTTLAVHPLSLWPSVFKTQRIRARDLARHIGSRITLLGWPITAKPVLTSSEEPMEFVSLEDETAIFEGVLFPDSYAKYRHLLFDEGPLWVEGLVECDRGAVTLTIERIRPAIQRGRE
jgi:DNA polymerase-3 subunit alpha/error-prone DNA polymerase